MGPVKGKKAWRKKDASEVDAFREAQSYQERRGPAVESLQDDQLFFVDKSANEQEAQAVVEGRKRKREPKILRSQQIIQAAHAAKPVVQAVKKKAVGPLKPSHAKGGDAGQQQQGQEAAKQQKQPKAVRMTNKTEAGIYDLWDGPAPDPEEELELKLVPPRKRSKKQRAPLDPKARGLPTPQAVEVDAAGCSYNPDQEAHQEALAMLVAQELKKQLKRELAPMAPPKLAPEGYQPLSELEALQVDAEPDDDEEEEEDAQAGAKGRADDANEIALSGDDDEDAEEGRSGRKKGGSGAGERKTKKERNKEMKRKQQERELAARRQLKAQRAQLSQLKALQAEVAEREAEAEARRQRRELDRLEKAKELPPKLGKQRYEAPSVAVATTDELGGSLRTVKPSPLLALERFKSLQKRGLIEPRRAVQRKQARRVAYEKGARTEKAMAAQQEIEEMRRSRQALAKQLKAGSKE